MKELLLSIFRDCLRADEAHEDHEANNLPETLCGLRKREEVNYNVIPEKLTNKRQEDKRNHEGEKNRNAIGLDLTLHIGSSIRKTLNGRTACRLNRRHFLEGVAKISCLQFESREQSDLSLQVSTLPRRLAFQEWKKEQLKNLKSEGKKVCQKGQSWWD